MDGGKIGGFLSYVMRQGCQELAAGFFFVSCPFSSSSSSSNCFRKFTGGVLSFKLFIFKMSCLYVGSPPVFYFSCSCVFNSDRLIISFLLFID